MPVPDQDWIVLLRHCFEAKQGTEQDLSDGK